MWRRAFFLIFPILAILWLSNCKRIDEQEKYQSPGWLAGKLYTQVSEQENLGLFTEWLQITGFDTILDVSGSFTVFAPSDEAIRTFLSESHYATSLDIPVDELEKIVKFHIIQNAWNNTQLQSLDVEGWIDSDNPDSKPKAYKRQTLLKNPDEKYSITKRKDEDVIVRDSTLADDYKTVYTRSRKYVPIFFNEFFSIYDLSYDDYAFYFGRNFEPGNVYYAGAKVVQSRIFAENGFIYVIDKVVPPMLNARELLKRELPGETYFTFLDLIYQFPEFTSNFEETYNQAKAREGGDFDTLYDLSFPRLPFDLHEELTGPNINVSNYTYAYHNGMCIPTDEAFEQFIREMVTVESGYPHWPDFESVPLDVKQIIVNSHFTNTPVYLTDLQSGFKDGAGNIIKISQEDIIRKEFGSNCTFLGLNQTIVPRAFSSVTGPVYLRPEYSILLYAMQYSRVLNALTKERKDYSFFIIPDDVMELDSSLIQEWIDVELNRYRFKSWNRSTESFVSMSADILGKRILNQVGITSPNGSANKEFIETLGGNYLIYNNSENSIQGTRPNVYGYNGDSLIYYQPDILSEPADNGATWSVKSWFRHSKVDMYGALSGYPEFVALLNKAGLYDAQTFSFPFLTEGEFYTIFMPNEEALANSGADTLSKEELGAFLRYHFVKGHKIFTDNKKPWQSYVTLRKDESSTQYSTKYSPIEIRPGPDRIEILDSEGISYITISESEEKTNIVVATDTDRSTLEDTDFIITAVIHEIDMVLIKQ